MVHLALVVDGERDAVQGHGSADVLHPAFDADQAVAERGLAAARLAGKAHDLAVGDAERDAVQRLDVAGERSVVDPEVRDLEAHRLMIPGAAD